MERPPHSPLGPSLPDEDGAGEEVEQARDKGGMAGREEANPAREGEHPHRHLGQDVPDEVVRPILHPAGGAGAADRSLAREGHEPLETAVGTANSREAVCQNSTGEVGADG